MLDDVLPALTRIYAETSARDTRFVFGSDSSGGGLARALVQVARAEQLPSSDAVLLIAPLLDLALSNLEAHALEHKDPALRIAGARVFGSSWAGDRDLEDPLVSPIHADLSGLPPLHLVQGGRDVLAPDVQKFVAKAIAAGVPVHMTYEPSGFHVYPLVTWLPEARRALAHLRTVIRCLSIQNLDPHSFRY